jgi:hypothetical protein
VSYSNPIEHLYQEELYNLGPKVLIIIPMQWDTLPESEQVLLSKILAFIKRSLSSVQVLALSEADTDDLLIYRPSRIIAFGSTIKASGKSVQSYQLYENDSVVVLQADSLDQLDDPKKKILRNALRELFQL